MLEECALTACPVLLAGCFAEDVIAKDLRK